MNEERKIEIAELSVIMSTKGGRNFISRIIDRCGLFSDIYSTDTHEHARLAGRRQIGLWLLNEIKESTPGEYITLMKERNENEG